MNLSEIISSVGLESLKSIDDYKKVRRELRKKKNQLDKTAYETLMLLGDEQQAKSLMQMSLKINVLIKHVEDNICFLQNLGQFSSYKISDPVSREFYFQNKKGGAY